MREQKLNDSDPTIKTTMTIHDNYDIFKAHLMIFGNKQYLFRIFNYKHKDGAAATSTSVSSTVNNMKTDKEKTHVTVDNNLITAAKRQRKAPAGAPKGAGKTTQKDGPKTEG